MQSIDSIETYEYGMSKDLAKEKEEIKCNNIIKRYKKRLTLIMSQKKTQKNIIRIGHKFLIRILIVGGPGSGKTNSIFNLINEEPDTIFD